MIQGTLKVMKMRKVVGWVVVSGGGCSFIPPTVEPNEQSERKFFVDSISGLLICTPLPSSSDTNAWNQEIRGTDSARHANPEVMMGN